MAQVPANPRLWAMVVTQARAKFRVYPSPAAAHWVHQEYTTKGGTFVDGKRQKKKAPERRGRRGQKDN